jgi:hypothetical protein
MILVENDFMSSESAQIAAKTIEKCKATTFSLLNSKYLRKLE